MPGTRSRRRKRRIRRAHDEVEVASARAASGLTRVARTFGTALARGERAARDARGQFGRTSADVRQRLSVLASELRRMRKLAAGRPAARSRLTTVAGALGTALGRTERAVRDARESAIAARRMLDKRIAAISADLKRARSHFQRAARRGRRG